jgi:dTDP-4-amino-4,6-dideoxygalactose transaminase
VNVPLVDLRAHVAAIRPEIDECIRRVLDDQSFILGENVARFEAAFANYTGRRHCIGLNSGTSALHLALLLAGVGPGNEVVTTPLTWVSTAWAISYCGARPGGCSYVSTSRSDSASRLSASNVNRVVRYSLRSSHHRDAA